MSKVKAIIIGVAVLFVTGLIASLYIQQDQIARLEKENARVDFNNFQLMKDNQDQTVLYLKQKEVTGNLRLELEKVAEQLRVKPKNIEKIIYRTITEKDTVDRPVFVDYRKTHWMIADTGNCFTWSGMAYLSDTLLKVTRENFTYQNKTTEVYYRKRPHQFLFIKYGKWVNMRRDSSQCGGVTVKEFNFSK